MMTSTMISKWFSRKECTRSRAARELGRDNQPTEVIWSRIHLLMTKVMDPIRDFYGLPIDPSSVYRDPVVNVHVGGSATSQHPYGEACDFNVPGVSVREVMRFILKLGIPFDQLIDEYGSWVHISYTERRANRGEIWEYRTVNGRTVKRRLRVEEV